MKEPYCPLSSAVCNATNLNITIIWDGQICMFAVLLRFTLSCVYKVYIGFLSRMRDWTVAIAQYSKFAC
jgi:hypothetical protein